MLTFIFIRRALDYIEEKRFLDSNEICKVIGCSTKQAGDLEKKLAESPELAVESYNGLRTYYMPAISCYK